MVIGVWLPPISCSINRLRVSFFCGFIEIGSFLLPIYLVLLVFFLLLFVVVIAVVIHVFVVSCSNYLCVRCFFLREQNLLS